jgi:hypothetical protein
MTEGLVPDLMGPPRWSTPRVGGFPSNEQLRFQAFSLDLGPLGLAERGIPIRIRYDLQSARAYSETAAGPPLTSDEGVAR